MRFYLYIFFFLSEITLLASPSKQAAVLAHDVYLPQKQFLHKYKSSDYQLVEASTRSIKFYIFSQKDQLFIVFEGTHDVASIQSDLDVKEVQFLDKKESRVHKGYYTEAIQAYTFIRPYLGKEKKIIITGHSLGGAVGHLVATLLYENGYRVKLYTFGSPPVGNQEFVEAINGLPHERYTHVFDVIPLLKKEYVLKIKEAFVYVNKQLPENKMLYDLIASVDEIPYEYVHQGEHHYIYNLEELPLEYENSPWYTQMLMRAKLYHSSKSYLDGVK